MGGRRVFGRPADASPNGCQSLRFIKDPSSDFSALASKFSMTMHGKDESAGAVSCLGPEVGTKDRIRASEWAAGSSLKSSQSFG